MPLDKLKRFPNQLIEQRPTECAGEMVADIVGNITGYAMDAGFNYAAALKVMGTVPTTAGSNPLAAMTSAVIYGTLPTTKEPFDAATTSELYEANLANFSSVMLISRNFAQNGVTTLPLWADIIDYLDGEKQGVALEMLWYPSFLNASPTGVLPAPAGTSTNHCVAVYGYDARGLCIKPWLGPNFGYGGYVFLPYALFSQLRLGAWAVNMDAWRWSALVRAWLSYPAARADIWPQLSPLS